MTKNLTRLNHALFLAGALLGTFVCMGLAHI